MDLFEAIYERHSVRTFTGQVPGRDITDILNLPQHDGCRIVNVDTSISGQIGSYGIIKNAPAWLALVTDGSNAAMLRCAMDAERAVLRLCSSGLGSCWVGGTFNSSDAEKKAGLLTIEKISAVIPYGYAAARKRFIERVTSALAHSSTRKPFEALFTVDKDTPQVYHRILEAVRCAPSAVNAQPWRVNVDKNGNALFSSVTDNTYTMLDMGIALEHFLIAAGHYGVKGKLEIAESPTPEFIGRWIAAKG